MWYIFGHAWTWMVGLQEAKDALTFWSACDILNEGHCRYIIWNIIQTTTVFLLKLGERVIFVTTVKAREFNMWLHVVRRYLLEQWIYEAVYQNLRLLVLPSSLSSNVNGAKFMEEWFQLHYCYFAIKFWITDQRNTSFDAS